METLYSASWQQTAGPALIIRHGLDADSYNRDFATLPAQGYRPTCISGGGDGRGFSSIWERSAGPGWMARHGMTSADYQREFDTAAKNGFRPRCINAYQDGGEIHFAVLWDDSPAPAWRARHDMDAFEYQRAFDDNFRDGFRPVWLTVYPRNGAACYAAIWEQTQANWESRHDLSPAEYQAVMEERSAAGFRLVCGNGCATARGDLYAGIWEAAPGQQWAASLGLDQGQHQQEFDRRMAQGFRPRFVVSYQVRVRPDVVPPWYVAVQLVSLSGSGSDVDEIYGVLAAAVYDSRGKLGVKPGTTDPVQELLRIDGSMDFSDGYTWGRGPGYLFQMPSNIGSGHGRLALRSYLYDEDDGRDAHPDPDGPDHGNDEHFAFRQYPGGTSYVRSLMLLPPGATVDDVDFERQMQVQLTLEAKGNSLTAFVRVRWFRHSDFVAPQ
ncbi:MAG: hypothetical protein ACREX5_12285 [Achromobacter pestifer]